MIVAGSRIQGHVPAVGFLVACVLAASPAFGQNLAVSQPGLGFSALVGGARAASAQTRLSSGDKSDHRISRAGTPGWTVVSVGSGRPLGSKVEVTGTVENLFNEAYRVHGSGVDGFGRSAWIGLRLSSSRTGAARSLRMP